MTVLAKKVGYLRCMSIEHKILSRLHPERESFTEEELRGVSEVLSAARSLREGASPKRRYPSVECGIGETVTVCGVEYVCVAVPEGVDHRDCCSGCDFSRRYRNCDCVKCSAFDRADRRFVWYVETSGEEVCDGE